MIVTHFCFDLGWYLVDMSQEFIQRSAIKRDYSKEKGLGLLQALLLCFELTGSPDSALSRSKRVGEWRLAPQPLGRESLEASDVDPCFPGLSKASWR